MPTILDACSIINLFNAGALAEICCLDREEFWVTPIVAGECGPECAAELVRLNQAGQLRFFDDHEMPAARFLELVLENDIGEGEIEAIVACEVTGYSICTDDGAARRLAARLLGPQRVMGGLRLLKWSVEDAVSDCATAFARYLQMKATGGFLPRTEQEFFCAPGSC